MGQALNSLAFFILIGTLGCRNECWADKALAQLLNPQTRISCVSKFLSKDHARHGLQDGVRALGWIGDARALPLLEAREGDPDVSYDLLASDGTLRLNAATEACDAIRAKARKRTQ